MLINYEAVANSAFTFDHKKKFTDDKKLSRDLRGV